MVIYKLNNVDISDYIVSSNRVPFVSRNRDWTITSNGFGCSISYSSSTVPTVGGIFEVYNDSNSEFLGIISDVTSNYDAETYDIQVAHYFKNGLKDKTVKESVLIPYFIDTSSTKSCAIDTVNNRINVIMPFGTSIGDFVYFQADTFPDSIDGVTQYEILDYQASYIEITTIGGSSAIQFTTTGSNVVIGVSDKEKYIQKDKDGYPSIQFSWLITCLCDAIGFTANLSNLSGVTLINALTDGYLMDIDSIRLDTNMLFCVNQNIAVVPSELEKDENTLDSQISCFDLLSEFCSHWGMFPKYTGSIGNREFTFFAIPRTSSGSLEGNMLLSSNISYSPSDVYSKTSKTVDQESDFCKTEIKVPLNFNTFVTSQQRGIYASATKSELEVFYKYLFSFKYTMTTESDNSIGLTLYEDIDRLWSYAYFTSGDSEAAGLNLVTKSIDVNMYSNIMYYPSNSFEGGNSWDIVTNFSNPAIDSDIIQQIYKNKVAKHSAKWTTETVETDIVDSESRVKQNEIAPEGNGTSVIVQEKPSI